MDAQETSIYHAIIITAVVLGIIIIFFVVSIIRQQRRNVELQRLNIIAEITALEKERTRIAADLHDDVGPSLSAIKMEINSFELSDHDDKLQIEKTNTHIDDVIQRIREISFNLMPNSLLRKGLVTAIKEFTDHLNLHGKTKFVFTAEKEIHFSEQKAINLYRIVQEMAHNTLRHAQADEVRINIWQEKNMLKLEFADNGIGFDQKKEVEENIGFGLKSLLRRTEILEGQMYLDAKLGKGTVYSFDIPL